MGINVTFGHIILGEDILKENRSKEKLITPKDI